jgi:ATP-dependent helicase/DNAse subunit B
VKSAISSKSLMKNLSTPSLNADTSTTSHEIDQLSNQLGLAIQPSKSTGAIRKQNVNNYLFMHTNITNRNEDAEAKDAEHVTITETSLTRKSESGNLARNLEEFLEKLKMTETAANAEHKTTENVKKVTFEKDDTEPN